MLKPTHKIIGKFSADIVNFAHDMIFAFDFAKEVYWTSDVAGNGKKIAINIPKSEFRTNKVSLCKTMPLLAYIDLSENNVVIVDVRQSKAIKILRVKNSKIESISMSRSGETILIGSKNGILSRWHTHSGKLLGICARHKNSVLLSQEGSEGRFIASIGCDRSVMLFDKTRDKIATSLFIANAVVQCVRFSRDSTLLILGDMAGYVYVVDTRSKTILHRFKAARARIKDVYHYKDSCIFYLSGTGIVGVADFDKEKNIIKHVAPQKRYNSLVIDDDFLILSTSDKEVCVYNFTYFFRIACKGSHRQRRHKRSLYIRGYVQIFAD